MIVNQVFSRINISFFFCLAMYFRVPSLPPVHCTTLVTIQAVAQSKKSFVLKQHFSNSVVSRIWLSAHFRHYIQTCHVINNTSSPAWKNASLYYVLRLMANFKIIHVSSTNVERRHTVVLVFVYQLTELDIFCFIDEKIVFLTKKTNHDFLLNRSLLALLA